MNTTIHFRYGSLMAQVQISYTDPFSIDSYEFSGEEMILNIFKSKLKEEPSGYFVGPADRLNIEHFFHSAYQCKRSFEKMEYAVVNPPDLGGDDSDDPDVVY